MSGTRAIYAATGAVLALIATLSVITYRATERDAVASFAAVELAVARTVAIAIDTEVKALASSLRQLNTLPSVQVLNIPFIGQRVRAAFAGDDSGTIRQVVRIDGAQRRHTWSAQGDLIDSDVATMMPDEVWQWFSDRRQQNQVRVSEVWWDARDGSSLLAFTVASWRVATSAEEPVPPNNFNGVLAFVVDVERLVQSYARPGAVEAMGGTLALDLGQGDGILRISSDGARRDVLTPDHVAQLATAPEDARVIGNAVVAFTALEVPGARWMVILSTPYAAVASSARSARISQLALIALLLVTVPALGWALVRRERRADDARRTLELQLAQSQKMDAIGKLAGGVAHDFNNLLTAIIGYSSLILEDVDPQSPVHQEATQIKRAADSAATLTQKLLAFSRRQVLQPQQIAFSTLLGEIVPLITRVIGGHIVLESETDDGLWPVVADPVQVEQALINLAINSRDAMPDGGTLTITARNAPRPNGERRTDHMVSPGDYVLITVRDTGQGMDEETRARMFEPFFTTKPKGKGTGLGLSTVYGITKQSGGYINVVSTVGRGTSIEMLFPRAAAAAAPAPAHTAVPEQSLQGTETILLVEDDPAVRELTQNILERHGYRVLSAPGAEPALAIANEAKEHIALLLSDVVMPGMQGPELAGRLRLAEPGLRVLFMSGYAAGSITGAMLRESGLIMKPFSAAALTRAVRQVLDRDEGSGVRGPAAVVSE
ncbi:MAG TPA: ATP-binding protein [Vicinamibacterales bacterium]|nr:ATP-binding protein [Vicinamibacterales bacterium]